MIQNGTLITTPTWITISSEEIERALEVGYKRARSSLKKERKNRYEEKGDTAAKVRDRHRLGAAAEIAVARWLGVKWAGDVNTFHAKADVAGYEVRSRNRRVQERGRWVIRPHPHPALTLIVRTNDRSPDAIVIFATGLIEGMTIDPEFILWGWITVREGLRVGRRSRNATPEDAARFVAKGYLYPMETLPGRRRRHDHAQGRE